MSRTDQEVVIKRNKNVESEYRAIDRLSYSALKQFDTDRKKFWKKYILKEDVPKEESDYLTMGTLVDFLKTEPESIDEFFVINTSPTPKPQMKVFCDILALNKQNYEGLNFEELLQKSYDDLKEQNGGKIGTGFEKYVINFNTEGLDYYKEVLNSHGKTVISVEQLNIATSIVDKINKCSAFKPKGVIIPKVQVLFSYKGHDLKSELDEVEDLGGGNWILYDYKASSFLESFFDFAYIKMKYYIQQYLYQIAFKEWCIQNDKLFNSCQFKFKVMDMNNYSDPILYEVPKNHFEAAKEGFIYRGRYIKGVDQILDEITYHTKVDNWTASKQAIENNSTLVLPELELL